MNDEALKYAERLVPRSYIDLARQARRSNEQQIRQIIEHRKLPEQPLEERSIEQWLHQLAQMDSNNFEGNIGVGEREGSSQRTRDDPQYHCLFQVVSIHRWSPGDIISSRMESVDPVISMLFNRKQLAPRY